MEALIGKIDFDLVRVLKDEEATYQAVKNFFRELDDRCRLHKKENSGYKFLFFVYYCGVGTRVGQLEEVCLWDK